MRAFVPILAFLAIGSCDMLVSGLENADCSTNDIHYPSPAPMKEGDKLLSFLDTYSPAPEFSDGNTDYDKETRLVVELGSCKTAEFVLAAKEWGSRTSDDDNMTLLSEWQASDRTLTSFRELAVARGFSVEDTSKDPNMNADCACTRRYGITLPET